MCKSENSGTGGKIGRRALLAGAAAGIALPAAARAATPKPIDQPRDPGPRAFMRRAEQMRDLAGELRTTMGGKGNLEEFGRILSDGEAEQKLKKAI